MGFLTVMKKSLIDLFEIQFPSIPTNSTNIQYLKIVIYTMI